MTNAVLKIIGERQGDGTAAPTLFAAAIYAPEQTGQGEFACRVSIPALFEEDKRIFGVDEDHAKEVSAFFVRNLFQGLCISIRQEESAE